jgi:hypothetical protein
VPYRLRLFDRDFLLIASDDETVEGVGQRIAEATEELLGDEGSIRYEIVHLDESGEERSATDDEVNQALAASAQRKQEIGEQRMGPCRRCGRVQANHEEPLFPVRATSDGPIHFACWTGEERGEFGVG